MAAQTDRCDWLPVARALIASALGLGIGAPTLVIVQEGLNRFLFQAVTASYASIAAAVVGGIIAGAVQGAVLNLRRSQVWIWLLASGSGWVLARMLGLAFYTLEQRSFLLPSAFELLLGGGMGFCVGSIQWIVLRTHWRRSLHWVADAMLIWGLAWVGVVLLAYALMGPAL